MIGLLRKLIASGAGKRSAHAGRWHHAAHGEPRDESLQVDLGELIQIGAARYLVQTALIRNHGELYQVVLRHKAIEDLQGQRVDNILRILQAENLVAFPRFTLPQFDRFNDPVQAVRFAGRAFVGAHDAVDVWTVKRRARHFHLGRFIVGVCPYENVVVRIFRPVTGGLQHCADDGRFIPRRHHDGNALFRCGV